MDSNYIIAVLWLLFSVEAELSKLNANLSCESKLHFQVDSKNIANTTTSNVP